jgi:HD-like signal output (HDOD) protein
MPTTTDSGSGPDSAPPAVLPGKSLPPELQRAMSRVTEINSLPEITTRIVQVVEDPRATALDMHEIVKNDPALAAKILKVVNSAFYGLPSQIASLDRAIIMLGLSAVKNIAMAASLARLFRGDAVSEHFSARDLWRHCIAVGVCARALGQAAHNPQAEEFFVAGLVHDLGLLVTGQLFPRQFREVADCCSSQPSDFCALEEQLIGADHQCFGGVLATKWRFPPALRYANAYHHDPAPLQPDFRKIATFIYVADTICCKMQHGFYLTAQAQEITTDMLDLIGVTQADLAAICETLIELVTEVESIFAEP